MADTGKLLQAPIPGQSLTDTPKNYPWERPPEMTSVEQVTEAYIKRLANQDAMDDLAILFDSGLPISVFVEGMMTAGVGAGKHSVDVGLIVAPVLHKFLKAAMKSYGIDAKDNYKSKEELSKEKEQQRTIRAINLAIGKADSKEGDAGVDLLEEVRDNLDAASADEMTEEQPTEEMTEETPPKGGLMSKGV